MASNATNSLVKFSPLIEKIQWGSMKIEGFPEGKDFKLYPGGAEEWDWRKSNTRHVPGIQIADVKDLLDKNAEILILSRGMENRLEIATDTQMFLEQQSDIQVHIETTEIAVKIYNELAKKQKRVGALIHSTC